MTETESLRQVEQERLDQLKTAQERNRLGQFATPAPLALDIARHARGLWREREWPVTFLDPAVGTGSFYSALRQTFPPEVIADACGVEIDPAFAAAAERLWSDSGLRVIPGDFTALSPDRRYDLILTNPPYVRHHHLERGDKERLKGVVADRFNIEISGLAGLYAHFLLLCDAWMAPGGLAVWLIPSESMDVNYGAAVKSYLAEHVKLLQIHRYCPSDVQFCDALVTSAIVVFEKGAPPDDHQVRFTFGGPITNPESSSLVPLSSLRPARKWTSFRNGEESAAEATHTLGEFFTIKRGLATGANSFFILPRAEAIKKGIPAECLRPILPSSRHLDHAVIESEPDGYPRLKEPLALIDCDLGEDVVRERHPAFWEYLEQGRDQGVPSGYLASRRAPWYSQEKRPPAPFLCTYMGRQGTDGNPFRFFWNKSQAIAANVYLLLYPKGAMKAALSARPDLYPVVFSQLQAATGAHLVREGRVYGGGLHKLEPRELANLSAGGMARVIEGRPAAKQRNLAI